ncbi:M67 family metallopeptidase [Archangium lansingense]|uniref:M67 family metallopeptidase n=1 Tax=Archangium lansingense TaxID=2995310 RepID=A0ABT4A7S1_9BACT|nr:M67 family metallopeptidase [Archangium lansinium]MCY1077718.1 M67 family metallopeptidase [Archangium lansinium]
MSPPLPEDLSDVIRHLVASYPREGCGVLLRAGDSGPWRVRPLRNVQDELHAREPVRFPRTSRTAYAFEPREWLGVLMEAEARGEYVACVFHSHVDGDADFSEEDRRQATPDGEPLLPGVSYLVIAIHSGYVRDVKIFWWECGFFRGLRVLLDFESIHPSKIP